MLKSFPQSDEPVDVCVLEGREAILARSSALSGLAAASDQAAAMGWLPFFLDERTTRWKRPCMVTVTGDSDRGAGHPRKLLGVAIYFEYRAGPLRSGAFATDDIGGFRAVVAPPALRAGVAALATEAVVRHGALVVLTTYAAEKAEPGPVPADLPRAELAMRLRRTGNYLHLEPTIEATMATLGKRTRTHLRYYQRRLVAKTGCSFFPDVRTLLTREDFLSANAASMNPVSGADGNLRYNSSCGLPDGWMCGLRAADGTWLSLAGGWRQGATTVLQWQINAAGRERDSVSTAMRAFLLETEVARGAERLLFHGGTSHSMRHSFVQEDVCDVVVRRRSWRTAVLVALCRLVATDGGLTGRANFIAEALYNRTLDWKQVGGRTAAGRVDASEPFGPFAPKNTVP